MTQVDYPHYCVLVNVQDDKKRMMCRVEVSERNCCDDSWGTIENVTFVQDANIMELFKAGFLNRSAYVKSVVHSHCIHRDKHLQDRIT